MKYRFFAAGCFCLLIFSGPGAGRTLSEEAYLTDTIKVMMRSGPGIDYKITAMPRLGQAVTVLEAGEEWTRIRLVSGREGWVLNRFIAEEVPQRMLLSECRNKYADIAEKYTQTMQQKEALVQKTRELQQKLARQVEGTAGRIERLTRENEKLSRANRRTNRLFRAFLYGAGVLLVGIFIGSRIKKDKRRRYLV